MKSACEMYSFHNISLLGEHLDNTYLLEVGQIKGYSALQFKEKNFCTILVCIRIRGWLWGRGRAGTGRGVCRRGGASRR